MGEKLVFSFQFQVFSDIDNQIYYNNQSSVRVIPLLGGIVSRTFKT